MQIHKTVLFIDIKYININKQMRETYYSTNISNGKYDTTTAGN